jgi:hypothetical protein
MDPCAQIRNAGAPLSEVCAWGRKFRLVGESKWSLTYQYRNNYIKISKVQVGLMNSLDFKGDPSSLSCNEAEDAASSLYGLGDGIEYLGFRIPDRWQIFAKRGCS